MKKMRSRLILALGTAIGFCAAAPSFAQGALPAVQQQGDVRYVTGGVGVEEAKAMRAESPKYPLSLELLVKSGNVNEFAGKVDVQVTKGDGASVFSASSDGPFMLIDLPPGKYHVKAVRKGVEKSRDAEVQKGKHAGMTFEWVADKDR